jgi:hypothetical protein
MIGCFGFLLDRPRSFWISMRVTTIGFDDRGYWSLDHTILWPLWRAIAALKRIIGIGFAIDGRSGRCW